MAYLSPQLALLEIKNVKVKYKILYLTYLPQIGGGETILLSLLSKLDRKLFEPIVVIPKRGQLYKKLQNLKIKAYVLPLNGYLIRTFFIPGMSPTAIYNFSKLVQKIKPDLIHVNHLNLAVYAGIAAKLLKVLPAGRQVPTVATAHGKWDSVYLYQDFISNIFIDKILANTESTAQNLLRRKIIKPQKVQVVPFGVDTNRFKPATRHQVPTTRKALGLPPNGLIVTIVGRLDPAKDHLTFLKAARIIQNKLKKAKFFIVGSKLGDFSGHSDSYYKKINHFLSVNPSLAKKVVFGGFIESMPAVYNATDILVSTSPRESFGLALAEGAACGLPTVTTAGGTIVKNGQTGFLVQPQNPKAIAEKILTLAKNSKLRKEFGENGRKHITRHFQLQPYVARIENVYLSLLTNRLKSKRS